jgi:hypothetical protein
MPKSPEPGKARGRMQSAAGTFLEEGVLQAQRNFAAIVSSSRLLFTAS